MKKINFKIGDKVKVTFETEVISVRIDGKIVVSMVGVPLKPEACMRIEPATEKK